ncbi:hypothetical protein R5R35_011965 [Gryllus longicercus]|uniref:asparagine--tRNA ligase n=1 Tax=Gryllus longicercus TaxID=2509291 RepID=A0AAN9VRJ0_9ORTH
MSHTLKCFWFPKPLVRNVSTFSEYKNLRIADILATRPLGTQTSIKGWVKTVRKMKDNLFIDVNDGSCPDKFQIVLPKALKPDYLSFGASVEVIGKTTENVNGQLELRADELKILGPCIHSEGFPFAGKVSHPPEYIRKFLHLRSRTSAFSSILRIRSAASRSIHKYLSNEGYLNIHTPILTANDCEGAGEVFLARPENDTHLKDMMKHGLSCEEAYFDKKVFLTVSGQLHLEAMARGLGSVYTFGPTFRAENSRSRLHLSEFYMLEAEAAFMDNLDDLLKMMEKFIKNITTEVANECERDIRMLQDEEAKLHVNNLIKKPFQVLNFNEACSIINQHFEGPKVTEGLNKEQELFLVNYFGKVPVFVVEWPQALKPFYMKLMPDTLKVAAVDLLVPHVGELCGGSVRENDYILLEQKLKRIGQSEGLDWYLELRKFGNIPTSGFGMGFERFLQLLLGIANIKDTIPFPRWPHNCIL